MADEAIANFMAITGADQDAARLHLEAGGNQLEAAIELFFSGALQQGGGGGGGGGGLGGGGFAEAAGGGMGGFEDDEALARRLAAEGAGGGEEQVRAPDAVRTERLYGDLPHRPPIPPRRVDPVPHNVVDAFRDLGEGQGGASLASMFEPPRELLFVGSFEEAKQAALEQNRWLLLNMQSSNQFASHQLNRDTWRNDMVKSLVQNNFVFFQVYDMVETAKVLMSSYKIWELPATLVVDPVTGAPMRTWTGFLNAERMCEELLPFLDHDIHDPSAARLATGVKRKKSSKDVSRAGSVPLNEDEELQRALEMSLMEGGRGGGGGGGAGPSHGGAGPSGAEHGRAERAGRTESDDEDERAVMAALAAQREEEAQAAAAAAAPPRASPQEVAEAAAVRLPPEPEGGQASCRIAVRLPDGSRGMRRFPPSAPLAALHDYCLTKVEEAAGGRAFTLALTTPGAPALTDLQQTLADAQLDGVMVVMKWAD